MKKYSRCSYILAVISVVALPCARGGALEFEVASVKLEATTNTITLPLIKGGPGTNTPGRFRCFHVSLMMLITKAYDVFSDQVFGPDWLFTAKYSVDAIVPEGATKQEFQRMLQGLLAQRFSLVAASDQRMFKVYRLVIAKGGSKLRPSPAAEDGEQTDQADEIDPSAPPVQVGVDKNGCPVLAPGSHGGAGNFGTKSCMTFRRCPMPLLVQRLSLMLGMETGSLTNQAHIIDQTGLKGVFDFELKYAPPFRPPTLALGPADNIAADALGGQTIFGAVDADLGLKLEKSEARLPVLLIRQVVKTPSGN